MLRFIQLLPQASPEGEFLLKDLPGSGKRVDVLCRDLAACFEWGPIWFPKSNLELIALIGETTVLTFRYPQNQIPLGEVGWASVIKEALRGQEPAFVEVSEGSLDDIIGKLNQPKESGLWVLDEEGVHLSDIKAIHQFTQNSFMLGNHKGFDSQTKNLISELGIPKLSLGKKSYLSSHCLAAIISEFERKVR